ncbi:MAG: hypothetical protein L0196_11430 [candidate division Zixibacteria bacterium]|nr:hypothetical protein [candidate division Zixibacteria bacterium]
MFKKWLAVLGAVVLLVCTSQLLWGGGGGGDDHPWNEATGSSGTSSSVTSTVNTQAGYPLTRIYIVRPAPMGGFYLIRISLPSDASAKTAAGVKKAGN